MTSRGSHFAAVAYSFGPFRFDPSDALLCHGGHEKPLPPKAADVLEMLLRNAGHVVAKDELLEAVWEGTFVTESSLTDAVSALRHELDDDPHEPTYIQTIHRRGYRFIADVEVEGAGEKAVGAATGVVAQRSSRIPRGVVIGAAVIALVAGGLLAYSVMSTAPSETRVTGRYRIDLPPDANFHNWDRHAVALSPDGTHLAFSSGTQLYLRPMGELEAAEIQETSPASGTAYGGRSPFFSPDGRQLGYNHDDLLQRRTLDGGAPQSLCVAGHPFGASWGPDGDSIVYGQGPEGIWRVSVDGGEPEQLVSLEPGESAHGPEILPGGEWLLFTLKSGSGRWDDAQIVAQSLETGERTELIPRGTDARYAPTGHLVYARQQTLYAVLFDPDELVVGGDPVAVVEGVHRSEGDLTGAAHFSFSGSGDLVYLTPRRPVTRFYWVDRQGNPTLLVEKEAFLTGGRLSPDGQRFATRARDEVGEHIWIYEIGRDRWQRLTEEGKNRTPVWSPDGDWVVFSSDRRREYHWDLYRRRGDFSGSAEPLLEIDYRQFARAFSPDGRLLLFSDSGPPYDPNVSILHLEEDRRIEPLLRTSAREDGIGFSPGGEWIAYTSDETGLEEAYARAYPGPGGPSQISNSGARYPRWSPDGGEMLYWSDLRVMVVELQTEPAFEAGPPRVLFEAEAPIAVGVPFRFAPDGQQLLMIGRGHVGAPPQIIVVTNWFEELKRKVPSRR